MPHIDAHTAAAIAGLCLLAWAFLLLGTPPEA